MGWISRNWKKLLSAGCGVVGAVALVVPAAVPAAALCAVVVPAVNASPDVITAVKNVLGILNAKRSLPK